MSQLKAHSTLVELQEYVAVHMEERGFTSHSPVQECLLLTEEVGELAKAIRKDTGMTIDANSHFGQIAHELADVVWVATAIANMYGVNLEEAFREKEAINHGREWR